MAVASPEKKISFEKQMPISTVGVVMPPPILVQTDVFEGTLATLFRCVRENKINLMEIPLGPICEAYLGYVMTSEEATLDEAAAALTVLAYLLERKAWLLLPVDKANEEPEFEEPSELLDPTTFAYADIISALSSGFETRSNLFFRTVEPLKSQYELPIEVGSLSVKDLTRALEKLLRKAEPDTVELLGKPRRSLQEQMRLVLVSLTNEFQPIDSLIVGTYTRMDAVYWFLALLELIRLHRVKVKLENEDVLFAKI